MKIGNWLIIILCLLLPLGQLEKLPLGIEAASIYVHDLVLAAIWLYILFQSKLKNLFKRKTAKPFVVFTAIALASWLINYFHWGQESLLGLGYLVRWVLLSAPFFFLLILNTRYQILTTKLIEKSIFLLALLGWVQYLIFPDLTRMDYFGWDDHYFRLTGTLLDPNFMGALLVISLGLEFGHPELDSGSPALGLRNKFGTTIKKLFYLITLAFTYSRSSYLAWLVLLFGWGINKIFAKPIKGGITKLARMFFRSLTAYTVYFWLAVSAIIFILLPRPAGEGGNLARTASTYARFENWHQTWQVIKKNPVFGVGFNNYRLAVKEMGFPFENVNTNHAAGGADNSFLFVWATTGIFGLIAFLWLISTLRPWWLVLPIVIHSLFNHSLFYPWVLLYIWGIQAHSLNRRSSDKRVD